MPDWTRTLPRSVQPGMARNWTVVCALLAAMGVGCDRSAPIQTGDRRPAASSQEPAPAPSPVAAPQPPASSDNSLPATAPGLPAPTIGESHSGSTRSAGDLPILRAVRVGQQPAADRLVFEFDGTGLPGWRIEYVDRPVRDCGSGEPVPVAGDAWLQIRFDGAQAHSEAGEGTSGPRRRAPNQPVLRELVRTCDFEGEVTWVAGVGRPNPYTPRVLAAPARLVVDIAH